MQQARRIVPLSYVEPTGGVVMPGGVLRYAGGTTARWNSIEDHMILDPSATGVPSIPTLVETYNDLVWNLYQSGLVTTEPRIWFGSAGEDGVQLSLVGAPQTAAYVPYVGGGGAYNYISIDTVLTELNGMLGNTLGAVFRYEGGRVSLVVKQGTEINFVENPAAYGSTRRMLNRLFLRDISGYIDVPLDGPLLIQGQPITAPTYGVFPEPAPATNLQFGNQTANSFDVTWSASPTPGAAYYVRVEGRGVNKLLLTSSLSITLGVTNGLLSGESYTITIITTTPYEVSTGGNPSASKSLIIIIFPTFTLNAPSPSYSYIDLTWVPLAPRYSMIIQVGNDAPLTVGADLGAAKILKSTAGLYSVTAYLEDSGYPGPTQSVDVIVLDLLAPSITGVANIFNGTYIILTHVPPATIANIQDIVISATSTGGTINYVRGVSDADITISGLATGTAYTVSSSYRLTDGSTIGPAKVEVITTA